MLLATAGMLERVELIASDICPRVLGRAQTGRYGANTLRRAPMPLFARAFVQADETGGSVAQELVRAISWKQLNLVDSAAISALGVLDVIICRNVLIYFRDPVAKRVVNSMAAALTPGGILCVGVSESLIRLDVPLVCEERRGTFLYRKAGAP
jgi:chemotaxis protein methyltransferase CheR